MDRPEVRPGVRLRKSPFRAAQRININISAVPVGSEYRTTVPISGLKFLTTSVFLNRPIRGGSVTPVSSST